MIRRITVCLFLFAFLTCGARAAEPKKGSKAGDIRDDNELKLKLVWCPAGKFAMGSPKSERGIGGKHREDENQASVEFAKGYWLGRFTVTQAQWKKVMSSEPWARQDNTKSGDDYPATFVTWDDARDFCKKLTEIERKTAHLTRDERYDLPTEAQWEYACRAGTATAFYFGDDSAKLDRFAWFDKNAAAAGEMYAHAIGRKQPNPWGIYDMHGNVWQWCRDVYQEKLPGGANPWVKPSDVPELSSTQSRVTRGGCYNFEAANSRTAHRKWELTIDETSNLGFRVALVPASE